MKNFWFTARQAAVLITEVAGVDIQPEEINDLIGPSEPSGHLRLLPLMEGKLYGPMAIRAAHAKLSRKRAKFLLEDVHLIAPPVVLSHYVKGGAGKTSAAVNAALAMCSRGYRVLFIDADPQSSATELLGVDVNEETLRTLNDVVFAQGGAVTPMRDAVISLVGNGVLDLLPSDPTLNQFDGNAYLMRGGRDQLISRVLSRNSDFINQYDIILIDTNPAPSPMNFMLSYRCDVLLMSIPMDTLGTKCRDMMNGLFQDLEVAGAPDKQVLVLANAFSPFSAHAKLNLAEMVQNDRQSLMLTVIPFSTAVARQGWAKADGGGLSVVEREPASIAAKKYAQFTLELLDLALWKPRKMGFKVFESPEIDAIEESIANGEFAAGALDPSEFSGEKGPRVMKSFWLNAKRLAAHVCEVTGKEITAEEVTQLFDSGKMPEELDGMALRKGKLFGPMAVRALHARLLTKRRSYLLEDLHAKPPPVVVSNYAKGGSGKTSSAVNAAMALAARGYRVLFIDADPKCTSTIMFGVDVDDPSLRTLLDLTFGRDGKAVPMTDAIISLSDNGVLDLIAADPLLGQFEKKANLIESGRDQLFSRVLFQNLPVIRRYDVILIDTNASTSTLLNFVLTYRCDALLMSIPMDRMSMKSRRMMEGVFLDLETAQAPEKQPWILANSFASSTAHSKLSLSELVDGDSDCLMHTVIPFSAAVARQGREKKLGGGMSVVEREPSSLVAKRYCQFALELMEYTLWHPRAMSGLTFTSPEIESLQEDSDLRSQAH